LYKKNDQKLLEKALEVQGITNQQQQHKNLNASVQDPLFPPPHKRKVVVWLRETARRQ